MSKKEYTEQEKCNRKVWALRTAGLSIVFAFFALISYEASINLEGLPNAVFYKDLLINDSFLLFIALGVVSLILTSIGLVLSVTRRSVTSFILSSIIPFTVIAFSKHIPEIDLTDLSTSVTIKHRSYVPPTVEDVNVIIYSNKDQK